MAVTMAEITKLRHLTSAGLMDCKKALAETNGDIEAAVEILRKKGQAVAAKREDRVAAEGCVLSKTKATSPLSSPSSAKPTSLPKTQASLNSPRNSSTLPWPTAARASTSSKP